MGRRLFSRGMVGALVVAGAFAACSRSDLEGLEVPPAVAGSAGAAGADAAAGAAGADAAAGAAGADAAAGAAGQAGAGGLGGAAGVGGVAGSTGGAAGVSGSGGVAGAGGTGGVLATGGTGGVLATGGTGGVLATGGTGGGATDGGNFFDAFPFPDSGPIADCVSCADRACHGQVNTCFNDPSCANGVVCAVTSCGGGIDLGCILGCFGGDFAAAGRALQAFLCVTRSCGQECIGAIGSLGGGSSGGSAPSPGGTPPSPFPPGFSPRAGGAMVVVAPEVARRTGVPAGPLYVPGLEVLDSLPGVFEATRGSSAH